MSLYENYSVLSPLGVKSLPLSVRNFSVVEDILSSKTPLCKWKFFVSTFLCVKNSLWTSVFALQPRCDMPCFLTLYPNSRDYCQSPEQTALKYTDTQYGTQYTYDLIIPLVSILPQVIYINHLIHHLSSFIISHLHVFSSILFWSTPSCFFFRPHFRLFKCLPPEELADSHQVRSRCQLQIEGMFKGKEAQDQGCCRRYMWVLHYTLLGLP